ncbi:MAG: hypothetical protein LBQ31_07915 [Bacteroidales bacterium]|jgi:hypothetical protein|nr:hypothetical protein [Bacteroidales bacterium]
MKKITVLFLILCTAKAWAQESDFERYVKEVCVRTYDTNLYNERIGRITRTIVPPRTILYRYEEDSIKHLLSDKKNDYVFYESIMFKYDTTKNKDLQNIFFQYYRKYFFENKKQKKDFSLYLNKFLQIVSDTSYYLENIAYIQEECLMNISRAYYNEKQLQIISRALNDFDGKKIAAIYEHREKGTSDFEYLMKYHINNCLIAARLYMDTERGKIKQILKVLEKYNPKKLNWIYIALARLGDKEALNYCVSMIKKSNSFKRSENEIAFILQKEVINYLLKDWLYSDGYHLLPEEYGGYKEYHKYHAIPILRRIVEFDFSDERYKQSDEVEKMRLFFKLNKNYKINKEPSVYYNLWDW